MKGIIIGLVVSFMAVIDIIDGGKSLTRWMAEYERFLMDQIAENFRQAEEVGKYEQKTSEEIQEETPSAGSGNGDAPVESDAGRNEAVAESVSPDPGPGLPEAGTPVAPETESPVPIIPIYSVNGAVLAEDLQAYLYNRLCAAGIGWFYEYALLIAYQESNFDPLAENKNGRDKGLFQYRVEYYPGLDWRNPYAEADVFIQQMANRAYAGRTIAEMISAHNQSDWGPYCQEYVSIVMSWEQTLQRIR